MSYELRIRDYETRLHADLPTPAVAGFAKAGALQRTGKATFFLRGK